MKKLTKLLRGHTKSDVNPILTAYNKEKPPTAFDHVALLHRYRNFPEMLQDTDDEHYPQCRKAILDALVAQEDSFAHFICFEKYLFQLVTMRRDKVSIEKIAGYMFTNEICKQELLYSFDQLQRLAEHELFKPYADQFVAAALSAKQNHSNLIVGINSVKKCFEYFPKFKKTMLEILANDAEIFERCIEYKANYFCAFAKEHKDYTEAFLNHVCTNAKVFNIVIFHTNDIPYFLDQFPDDVIQNRLMDFIVADDARFRKKFPSFLHIYEFGKQQPKHIKKLLDKAVSMKDYVLENTHVVTDIIGIDNVSSSHAAIVEKMIIDDPKLLMKIVDTLFEVQFLFNHKALDELKSVFLATLYSNQKYFSTLIEDKKDLEKMTNLIPDEATKLRVYFEIHTQKRSLAEVMKDPQFEGKEFQAVLASAQDALLSKTSKLNVQAATKLGALSEVVKSENEPGKGKSASPPKNLQ